MTRHLDKDESIHAVVARLRGDLGESAFVIMDHWEPDLCAIGLASPKDHRVLAYISTYRHPPGEFSYELELPPGDGSEEPYVVAGQSMACDYASLLNAVASHLQS